MKKAFLFTWLILTTSFFFDVGAQETPSTPLLEFKETKKSVTTWGNLPPDSFLSFTEWKRESDIRDQIPDWEKIIRERNHREMVGRIFHCIGTCRIDRGESFFNGSYRTGLYEGDEIQTIGESYLWIFLFDGTMVRLSPQSSVTINEFNVGVKEIFINARLNAGNILWLSRQHNIFKETNVRETDVLFLPTPEYETVPLSEKKPYLEEDLFELISENNTQLNHYKALNQKIIKNNERMADKRTYAFLVMPNATIMGYRPSIESVVLLGGESYFKKRSKEKLNLFTDEWNTDLFLQLRGFENKELTVIQDDVWFSVDEKGRNVGEVQDTRKLDVGEFITKRIPSIMMGREIFFERYSEFAFRPVYDPVVLAKVDGYRLWGKMGISEDGKKEDMELRLDFLKEYFRRVETSNLLARSRFKERLEARSEKTLAMDYGDYFFIKALNQYYKMGEGAGKINDDNETGEVLNSTTKTLWKKMHGIR